MNNRMAVAVIAVSLLTSVLVTGCNNEPRDESCPTATVTVTTVNPAMMLDSRAGGTGGSRSGSGSKGSAPKGNTRPGGSVGKPIPPKKNNKPTSPKTKKPGVKVHDDDWYEGCDD